MVTFLRATGQESSGVRRTLPEFDRSLFRVYLESDKIQQKLQSQLLHDRLDSYKTLQTEIWCLNESIRGQSESSESDGFEFF